MKKSDKHLYPQAISRSAVMKFAKKHHAARPMIFWEKATVWDWMELAQDEKNQANTDLLLERVSDLQRYFSNEDEPDNNRSMVIIVKALVPTRREWLKLCQKYVYDY